MSRGERLLSVLAAVYDMLISSVVFRKGSGIQQHRLLVLVKLEFVFEMLHWSATKRFVVLSHGSGRLMWCE